MAASVNANWIKDRLEDIKKRPREMDITLRYNPAAQWLIMALSNADIPYKLYNLGAGVKRITTKDIDKCPCCKRKL